MVICLRTRARRYLGLSVRDRLGLNAFHRMRISEISRNIPCLCRIYTAMGDKELFRMAKLEVLRFMLYEYATLLSILVVDVPERPLQVIYPPQSFDSMKRHLEHIGIECPERFRFQSFDALKRILVGFGFQP